MVSEAQRVVYWRDMKVVKERTYLLCKLDHVLSLFLPLATHSECWLVAAEIGSMRVFDYNVESAGAKTKQSIAYITI